jgi:hypothetical protein
MVSKLEILQADVKELQKAEEELRRAEEELRETMRRKVAELKRLQLQKQLSTFKIP